MTGDAFRKMINSDMFYLAINMNDGMYYATADVEYISVEDLEIIIPVYDKYGWDTLLAYVAVLRGHDPGIPERITPAFKAAKIEIEKLKADGKLTMEWRS